VVARPAGIHRHAQRRLPPTKPKAPFEAQAVRLHQLRGSLNTPSLRYPVAAGTGHRNGGNECVAFSERRARGLRTLR
jgi:hypothetical protein